MPGRIVAALMLLCLLQTALARTVKRAAPSDEAASWTVAIYKDGTRICAGAQLSNRLIITLSSCIAENTYTKYTVVFDDGESRNIIDEQRKKDVVLFTTEVSSTVATSFASVAGKSIPSTYDGTFRYYSWDTSDTITATSITLVTDSDCTNQGVDRYVNKNHLCFTSTARGVCVLKPGVPIFGFNGATWLLLGLSTEEATVCDGRFRKAQTISKIYNWLRKKVTDCGSLPSIRKGTVVLDQPFATSVGSTATVTCRPGYERTSASITCKRSGKWQYAKCRKIDCGSLPSIVDGSVALDSTTSTFRSTASVTCNTGYDSDKASITCQNTGDWETATCTIKDCGSLPSISDGSVALDSTMSTYGSTASVTCNPGYDDDKASITCQSTGAWETATCTIKDCGSLPSISDGSVALDSTMSTYGSTASVTCNPGYDDDKASITCQSTGAWETATCTIKDCGSLPSISEASVALDSTTSTYGSTASVTCNPGYASDAASITCQSTGAWETATCTKACTDAVTLDDVGYRLCEGAGTGLYSLNQGRIELFINGEWGTVCSDYWGGVDATVLCRSLGFTTGTAKVNAYYGEGTGPIWLDEVSCLTNYVYLHTCSRYTSSLSSRVYLDYGEHDCVHSQDAGVSCT